MWLGGVVNIVIGVDPGATGALAAITTTGQLLEIEDMPMVDSDVVGPLVWSWISDVTTGRDCVLTVIEHVHAMPKQGVSSSFRFGRGKGVLEGCAAALGCPIELPRPSAWKRDMALTRDKGQARAAAIRLWPDNAGDFRLVKHDGRAEACLLAEWGRRLLAERGQL